MSAHDRSSLPLLLFMVTVPAVGKHVSPAGTTKTGPSHDRCADWLKSHDVVLRVFQDEGWVAVAHMSCLAAEGGRHDGAPHGGFASRSCRCSFAEVGGVHSWRLRGRYETYCRVPITGRRPVTDRP